MGQLATVMGTHRLPGNTRPAASRLGLPAAAAADSESESITPLLLSPPLKLPPTPSQPPSPSPYPPHPSAHPNPTREGGRRRDWKGRERVHLLRESVAQPLPRDNSKPALRVQGRGSGPVSGTEGLPTGHAGAVSCRQAPEA